MAVKHLSYLNLPEERRREAAQKAKAQLESLLDGLPTTSDQAKMLQEKLVHLDKWARGKIPITLPKEHRVQLIETVAVKER